MVEWARRAVGARVPRGEGRGDARAGPYAHNGPARAVGSQHGGARATSARRSAPRSRCWSTSSTRSATPTRRSRVLARLGASSTSSSSRRRCGPTTSTATRGSPTEQPIPIAAGEWLTTRFEHLDLMERGADRGRAARHRAGRRPHRGAARRAARAASAGCSVVPHLWKTGHLDRRRRAPRRGRRRTATTSSSCRPSCPSRRCAGS